MVLAWFRGAILALTLATQAAAEEVRDTLKTSTGTIRIVEHDGFDHGLTLNGRPMFTDGGAGFGGGRLEFDAVLPSRQIPRFAVLTFSTGGNACGVWGIHVASLRAKPWFSDAIDACAVQEIKAWIDGDALLVAVTGLDDANDLGDLATVTWRLDGTRLRPLPRPGVPNYWRHEAMHPYAFMGVAAIRKPIIDVLGDDFRTVRERLSVASEMETVDYRYLVGSGCRPHSCGSDEALLIVDGWSGDSWAAIVEAGKPRVFSPRSKYRTAPQRELLNRWLARWGVEVVPARGPVALRPRRANE